MSIVASGHAHIDVAWLWTLGQTRRKSGRTFHTVMRLMEQFPDYHFTQSQPQLYDYVRQDYPELFEQIKARIAEGRWEPIGGMWIEADCNLSGPESLARQFLLGRSFFRHHFGDVDTPVLWLPDVFGYAWNLPQLIKEAGLEYFFTIKIGWSQYNRLPYDSFWWQGLDGTRVLTHFSTSPDFGFYASTYNANASPRQVLGTWSNFQQKELQHELLMAFGYGDGGGGPTREMLENIREMSAFPATPQMRQAPVGEFFRKLEETSGDRLPTWNRETLYLELHRGTCSTRKPPAGRPTAERIPAARRRVHRIFGRAGRAGLCLPQGARPGMGAGVPQPVPRRHPRQQHQPRLRRSQEQYAEIRSLGEQMRDQLAAIGAQMDAGACWSTRPASPATWPSCLASGARAAVFEPRKPARARGSAATASGAWIDGGELPPYSVAPLKLDAAHAPAAGGLYVSPDLLENDLLRVGSTATATSSHLRQGGQRELPPGALANQFQAFEDRPLNWDAWDVDIFYDDKMWTANPAQSVKVVEQGPLAPRWKSAARAAQRLPAAANTAGARVPRPDHDHQANGGYVPKSRWWILPT